MNFVMGIHYKFHTILIAFYVRNFRKMWFNCILSIILQFRWMRSDFSKHFFIVTFIFCKLWYEHQISLSGNNFLKINKQKEHLFFLINRRHSDTWLTCFSLARSRSVAMHSSFWWVEKTLEPYLMMPLFCQAISPYVPPSSWVCSSPSEVMPTVFVFLQ